MATERKPLTDAQYDTFREMECKLSEAVEQKKPFFVIHTKLFQIQTNLF